MSVAKQNRRKRALERLTKSIESDRIADKPKKPRRHKEETEAEFQWRMDTYHDLLDRWTAKGRKALDEAATLASRL